MSVWNKMITQKFLKRVFFTILIAYIPLGIAVALLTPDNILENPLARFFTDFMSGVVPLVRETGRRTTVPATQFIAALMNCVAICGSGVFAFTWIKFRHKDLEGIDGDAHRNSRKEHPFKYFCFIFTVPLFPLCSLFFLIVRPYGEHLTIKEKLMLGSKIGMGTYGAGLSLSLFLTAVASIKIIHDAIAIQRQISRNKNKIAGKDGSI